MPLYFYTARNELDQLVRGTIDAAHASAATEALRQMSLRAEELHEATLDERKSIEEGDAATSSTPNLLNDEGLHPMPESSDAQLTSLDSEPKPDTKKTTKVYYPFSDTLRLYAGWLLAWYMIVYALGGYQHTRDLPTKLPYVEALLPPFSPIVLTFTLASFLFLLGGSAHKALGGGKIKGALLYGICAACFVLYNLNI